MNSVVTTGALGPSLAGNVGGGLAAAGGTLLDGRGADITGGSDAVGVRAGVGLASAGGRDAVGFAGAVADNVGRDSVGFGGALAGAESDIIGFGITLAVDVVDFATVLTGTGVAAAAFTGTLVDSGMSSQPASMSSSAGLAAFSVPRCEPPSAPEAISFRVPEPAAEVAASTVHLFVAAHTRIYEPWQGALGTSVPRPTQIAPTLAA